LGCRCARLQQEYSLPTTGDKPLLQWRIQQWIILFNANLDTSHPQSVSALRAKLKSIETARQRDKEKGKEEKISDIEQYAKDKKGEFERLRKEIMERDKKRIDAAKGLGAESPIEVD
jgi:E3 ubiquitin-protein ligase RAD18